MTLPCWKASSGRKLDDQTCRTDAMVYPCAGSRRYDCLGGRYHRRAVVSGYLNAIHASCPSVPGIHPRVKVQIRYRLKGHSCCVITGQQWGLLDEMSAKAVSPCITCYAFCLVVSCNSTAENLYWRQGQMLASKFSWSAIRNKARHRTARLCTFGQRCDDQK